jgi:hypothetical protein
MLRIDEMKSRCSMPDLQPQEPMQYKHFNWKRRAGSFSAALATLFIFSAIAQDNPEPVQSGMALPGQTTLSWGAPVLPKPYQKGVRVVGNEPIGGRTTNQQLVWIDHCAYVSSAPMLNGPQGGVNNNASAKDTDGVAVIDVSSPAEPKQVGLLRDRGAIWTVEAIAAVAAPDRKVLAVGDYAAGNPAFNWDEPPYLSIYDVSDCTRPKLMSQFVWPENVHTLTISADGKRIYAPSNYQRPLGPGALHVLDISDLKQPRYVGRFQVTGRDGRQWDFAAHEVWVSPDQRRIYAGVVASMGGDLNGGKYGADDWNVAGAEGGGIYILDNSDLVEGKRDPKLRLISTAHRGGWHNVMPATFNGVPHLVAAAEAGSCPGSFPRITRISDETRPRLVGEFRLEGNKLKSCNPDAERDRVANTHFTDVDDIHDTRLGLFNFEAAGLRIADLRDPRDPVEIAYFRPGDTCTGHVRYFKDTDRMWLVCQSSGFWVLELAPQLRAALRRER